jgi:hypothetical protein
MQYNVTVNFEGPIDAEAATGARRSVEIRGKGEPPESGDIWRIRSRIVWPDAAEGRPDAAELEIDGPMGGSLHGAFRDGAMTTITDQAGKSQASRLDLLFDVHRSGGRFEGSRGVIRLTGTLEPQGFRLSAQLDLDAPEGAWTPPNAGSLSDRELASGATPVGPQSMSQKAAERSSQASIHGGRSG